MPNSCGNPLLAAWLKEWWENAREQNSKGVLTYKKAYQSMNVCPITFTHPSEAVQLHGLGPKLCDRLTKRLEQHCQENGLPMPQVSNKNKHPSEDQDQDQDIPARPAKKPRSAKAYVPALRSGPFALIVALATVPEQSSRGLTKNELVNLAQPYCDSSFTAPSDPTKFYTAWNSMKTLQNKDLVYEHGRPTKRYALTEEGWKVAKRIKHVQIPNAMHDAPSVEKQAGDSIEAPVSSTQANLMTNVHMENLADRESQPTVSEQATIGLSVSEREIEAQTNMHHTLRNPSWPPSRTLKDLICLEEEDGEQGEREKEVDLGDQSAGVIESRPLMGERRRQSVAAKHTSEIKKGFTPIQISPGTFSIELIIDTREVRSKTDQSYIQNSLISHGITPTTRALPLGDALWVARLKPESLHLLQPTTEDGSKPTEILLGHIAERKRLDDLIGSIKDGRFHEQKFRLRRSGVPNVIYLIEDIALAPELAKRTNDMVISAITGTMVVGGFFVKRTRKLDESILYLARMTQMLQKRFARQGLTVLPDHALGDGRDVKLIRNLLSSEKYFMTFDAFASLAGKSDGLTLRDVFLKMLMCTKGITGDKAVEIQRRWNTPHAFIEALAQEGELDRDSGDRMRKELVFKAAGQLVGRKKIGKAVSTKVCDIWGEA